MTAITDDFNRADQNNLGASAGGWSWNTGDLEVNGTGRMSIVSNQAEQVFATELCAVRAEIDLATSDNYAQAAIVERGLADGIGVYCRMSSASVGPSGYLAYLLAASDTVQLYSNSGGQSFVQRGSNQSVTVSLPNTLKVEAVGTAIKTYWDGVQNTNASATDSTVSVGVRAGLRIGAGSSTARICDNFSAGDVGGGAFVPAPYYYRMLQAA